MPKSAEIILQPHLSTVVFVEPYGAGFAALIDRLSHDPSLQVVECISAMDTLSVVRQMETCVIFAHAGSAGDVSQHLTILKTLAQQIQRKLVRMIVTASSSLSTEQIEKLTIHGCTEILPDLTPEKALTFKLERHLKALPKVGDEPNDAMRVQSSGAASSSRLGPQTELEVSAPPPVGVRLEPALDVEQDCWTLGGGGARKTDAAWKVRVRGPAPDQGKWVAAEAGVWKWLLVEPEGPGAAPSLDESVAAMPGVKNGWYYGGDQKPEFQRGYWTFAAESPWLGYYEGDAPARYKFRVNDRGALGIAADSDAALNWVQTARSKASQKAARHEVQVMLAETPEPPQQDPESQVVYVDSLLLLSDFWLGEKLPVRRVSDRWLVQMKGPSAAVGRWVAQEQRGAERWFKWVPDAGERDPFLKEEGAWFFYGLPPVFSKGVWSFASTAPELGFYHKGWCFGSKFKWWADRQLLEVARDSAAAQAALPLMRTSFERQIPQRADTSPLPAPTFAPQGEKVATGDPRAEKVIEVSAPVAPVLDATEEKPKPLPGFEKIFAAEPSGPTLTGMALVFLAAELVSKRTGSTRQRCDRYCAYLHSTFGGLRAELWVEVAGQWQCVGTPDGSEGIYGKLASEGPGLRTTSTTPARVIDVRAALQDPIGRLIVGGRGAQNIELDYAKTAARAAVGLVGGARHELSLPIPESANDLLTNASRHVA